MADERSRVEAARRCLDGLSVGDGFGECFFLAPREWIAGRRLPDGPWRWTDDTAMAVSIVEELVEGGCIDEDQLARRFAMRFAEEPWRGYGGGASRLLARYAEGGDWRRLAPQLFEGGSWGNGASMRVAPVGAWFAGDPDRAADQGERSARVTHADPEGRAGGRRRRRGHDLRHRRRHRRRRSAGAPGLARAPRAPPRAVVVGSCPLRPRATPSPT